MAKTLSTMYRASLEAAMDEWLVSICEDDEWMNQQTMISEDLHKHMAQAAASVLDQAIEGQEWLRDEGYLE